MIVKKPKQVNLFIIGFPKAGTTSYAHYLNQHPDIELARGKEPHFFSSDFHKESDIMHPPGKYFQIRTLKQYQELFKQEGKKYYLDASTSYVYSKVAIRKIYAYNQQAKIIVMLRNPIAWVDSWYNYLKFQSEENQSILAKAWASETSRIQGENIPSLVKSPTRLYYSYISNYCIHLRRLYKTFPGKQVQVLLLEKLQADPNSVFNSTLQFLGLPDFRPDFIIKNTHQIPRFRFLKNLADKTVRSTLIKKIIPKEKEEAYRNFYRLIFAKKEKRSGIMDRDLRRVLEKHFTPMINELSELLKDQDLHNWWF